MKPSEAIKIIERLISTVELGYKAAGPLTDKGEYPETEALNLAISALEKQEKDRWRPCNEKPEYDFQNVLVRWHDKRKGCEKDYYIFEGYVVRGIWCGLFENVDISDFEPIEWKPLEPYTENEIMIKTPKDKVSYAIICDKFPEPNAYFSTYDLALRWLKLEQPDNRPHYIVKRTEHYEICDDKNIEEAPAANISEEFAKAVRSWLVNYQVKCAELEGRYTPYEILGWIVSDWRKENGIW